MTMPYTITNLEDNIIYGSSEPFTAEEVYNVIKEQPEGIYVVKAPGWCFGVANYEEQVMMLADVSSERTKMYLQEALDYQQK